MKIFKTERAYSIGDKRIKTVSELANEAHVSELTMRNMARFYGARVVARMDSNGNTADNLFFMNVESAGTFLKALSVGMVEPHKRFSFILNTLGNREVSTEKVSRIRKDPVLLGSLFSRDKILEYF